MPVETPHPDYTLRREQWQRCRDCYEGADKIKAAKAKYLPVLEGLRESDPAYDRYVLRAMFYPATERTTTGLIGMALRKPAEINAPKVIEEHLDDLTLAGDQFVDVVLRLLVDDLVVGRAGIFVDWAESEERPFWNVYCAEQIVNWRETMYEGKRLLTMVVLKEDYEKNSGDPFKVECATQYRVLELVRAADGATPDPQFAFMVRVFRQIDTDKKEFTEILEERKIPLRRNKPLPMIPFVFLGPRTATPRVEKPPLLDLVDLNLSHYRSSADLEHGRHFTALPTPWISGYTPTIDPNTGAAIGLSIGSGTAWVLPPAEAKCGMLEFTGTGLSELRLALEQKEKAMAIVGARLLESQPEAQETATAVRMRHAGESSVLTTIVKAASAAVSKALQFHAWWTGIEDVKKIECELNTEFLSTRISAQDVEALVKTWQAQGISYQTLYWNLQQGEWARPNVTWEEEQKEIEAENPEPDPIDLPPIDPNNPEQTGMPPMPSGMPPGPAVN